MVINVWQTVQLSHHMYVSLKFRYTYMYRVALILNFCSCTKWFMVDFSRTGQGDQGCYLCYVIWQCAIKHGCGDNPSYCMLSITK